jgi:carboxypeptidase family protein
VLIMKRLLLLCVVAFLAAYFVPTSVVAQTQFATISGTVTDEQGLAVPEAAVTATSVATGTALTTQTNKDGNYTIANVVPGEYDIAVTKQGFQKFVKRVTVHVAETLGVNFTLKLGAISQTITITESPVTVNTENAELSTQISSQQILTLPLLSRNAYDLMRLAVGAVDTGSVTGDTRGGGNAGTSAGGPTGGLAVNGTRTSDINFLLDGGENNDTFVAGVGQIVPLEAVQEFKVQTSQMSAEFGRNPINVNVITKSGTNAIHGTAWEYYRGSGISTASFDDNAAGRNPDGTRVKEKPRFDRNDFGFVLGGPIKKDKTFAFGSFEGLRVRSGTNFTSYVPTAAWLADASAPGIPGGGTGANYVNAFGGLPASNCSTSPLTAGFLYDTIEGNAGTSTAYGTADLANPGNVFGLFPGGTTLAGAAGGPQSGPAASLIPVGTNLFCQNTKKIPGDSGGGLPQNTWRFTGRIDHHFTDKTTLMGRFAYENIKLPAGSVSFSPYGSFFDTGQRNRDQNLNLALTHTFSPRLFSESRLVYNRTLFDQPEGGPGQAPTTTPCWGYGVSFGFNTATPGGVPITLPGYLPSVCAFSGIPFGGPQNIYQAYSSMTFVKSKHTIKWGGGYLHLRDNRTFGAYENGFEDTFTQQDMLNGFVDFFETAIDPKGHAPASPIFTANPAASNPNAFYSLAPTGDGPLGPPSFTRHFHYNEIGTFIQDSYRIHPRVTLDIGVRWEYFGVLHSPTNERFLDANLYLNAAGTVPPLVGSKTIFEQVRDARFQRTNAFYRQDWKNFAPRVGLAYDIFGNGRTVLRGGYGIFWDRNFGNATFNAIQNPPNYAVIVATPASDFGVQTTIAPNQFVTVGQLSGGSSACPTGVPSPCFRIGSSARMLNNDLKTAYTEEWNVTLQHDILGKGIVSSLSYVGTNGIGLYSLNNLNQRGSCVLLSPADQAALPTPCNPGGGTPSSRINRTGLTGMNRRGNEGLSRYNGLQADLRTREIGSTGVTLGANYTWSHSIDNESSFFADSLFEGLFGFGFRAAYNPALDRASSANDIRHRFTTNVIWAVPLGKNQHGIMGQVLSGWSLTSIVTAQTGGTFSVYDGSSSSQCALSGTNFCYPVPIAPGVPSQTAIPTSTPNVFTLYTLNNYQTQDAFCATGITVNGTLFTGRACSGYLINMFPGLTAAPHQYRLPGLYNWDAGVLKQFKLPREAMNVEFRADFLNVLNHSNLYGVPGTNSFTGPGTTVDAVRGCLPAAPACTGVKERRNIQLALKLNF